MAGRYEFDPFTPQEREILGRFLTYGGFLFAEDTVGAEGFGFDQAFRREMQQVLPNHELKRLPPDHAVYQSFYLLGNLGGRQKVKPYLEGIMIDNYLDCREEMKFITEAEHVHSTSERYIQEFEELKLRLGMDGGV